MLCNAQSLFRGTVMAKGIPRGYIVDEIATRALNTIWPNLLLRLKYPNKFFSIAEHRIDLYSAMRDTYCTHTFGRKVSTITG